MEVLAITQGRSGSTRLPNKILKTINGESLLDIHIKRILKSSKVDQLLIATTTSPDDAIIADIANKNKVPYYRGSEDNVLDRFYQAALPYQPKWVVRLTTDCPLIDPKIIDKAINLAIEKGVDYCSNVFNPTYPDGIDVEVFRFDALEKAWKEAKLSSEKEHVTPYIRNNSSHFNKDLFSAYNFENKENYGHARLTVDEPADFEVIKLIIEALGTDKDWKTYADYYINNDKVKSINDHINRNEGLLKSLKNDK